MQVTNHQTLQQYTGHAGYNKGRRNGHPQRILDMVGHQQLHYIGGVGTQHNHLAVSHIDHAHHTKGDGQTDGGKQQHRAQAQAKEKLVDKGVELDLLFDSHQRFLRRLLHLG